jgi:sulfur carrier protein
MNLKINGKEESISNTANLQDLILSKKLCIDKIVVEYNSIILPKEKWPQTFLKDNDSLEIISFVGGG